MLKRFLKPVLLLSLIAILVIILAFRRQANNQLSANLVLPSVSDAAAAGLEGYAQANGPKDIVFPRDNGPHPDYQTEWWYYTGNLETDQGRHFGYELTFFRRALLPPSLRPDRESAWASDQVYLVHLALTDVSGEQFEATERYSRGALGLAGASARPYQVWLDNWSVKEAGKNAFHLSAGANNFNLDLSLVDSKGPVLEGDHGYSQKGPGAGNASYYISQTRLVTQGTVNLGDQSFAVRGSSWMDHEYSTSALAPDQVGWDWFALQLDDGSELMVYQIRRADGSVDPFSSGTYIDPSGNVTHLERTDFDIKVLNTWRSPHSGAVYPSGWSVHVPSLNLSLEIQPYLKDQELDLTFKYWEGAVKITGMHQGNPVSGSGYVELTGYAGSMAGQF